MKSGAIAFSLWGNNLKYCVGAVENAKLAQDVYPNWKIRYYIDDTVPRRFITQLENLGAELVWMPRSHGFEGAFWRFLIADEFEYWLVRDTDSRLNIREQQAVQEWIYSDYDFHVMRDHPAHSDPVMAGCFGGRQVANLPMQTLISNWDSRQAYGDDQLFLEQIIWPIIKENVLVHDSFAKSYAGNVYRFPTLRTNFEFVGERYSELEQPESHERALLHRIEAEHKLHECYAYEGLCNRINGIASSLATGRKIKLHWAVNKHCPVSFEQIFRPFPGVQVINEQVVKYNYVVSPDKLCWFYPRKIINLPSRIFQERVYAAYRLILEQVRYRVEECPESLTLGLHFRHYQSGGDCPASVGNGIFLSIR